jgi:hypothetical protein
VAVLVAGSGGPFVSPPALAGTGCGCGSPPWPGNAVLDRLVVAP